MKKLIVSILAFLMMGTVSYADALKEKILPMRERAKVMDDLLKHRLDTLIPELMRREGIDAWVIISREYNEDPVLKTMLPATWLSARRRTVLIFLDHGEDSEKGVERLAASRYAVGDVFPGKWNPEEEPDQWRRIANILDEFNPDQIGLNYSDDWAHADGLVYSERRDFVNAIPDRLRTRIVSAERLAVGWLETRTEKELEVYEDVMEIAHAIIAEGFSGKVVTPGVTTRDDLVWWYRQRVRDLGLTTWFHTSISTERSDASIKHIEDNNLDPDVLYKGDHVHIDFGIAYLDLMTDTQQNAYILRDGETDAPEALKIAKRGGNRLQDILTSNFQVGRTGNEILAMTREQATNEGIGPVIYTHPIGLHGHAAGTTIGMWDKQEGVPGDGDYPMHANTAYSIELTALVDVPDSWSTKPMRMLLEQDGIYDGTTFRYIGGRQTNYHIIDPKEGQPDEGKVQINN
ncbi:M24 family metallopeptidase [Pseudemcibacter aquimaris]|uniref:M24 family metallopeptidase n=1 Tax=Pseudemcibacter aquimaris TaxID=2857064 RepID=UPI002013852E|nr:M24 family metallopeptidase [Pseudemcibacter aquimaris]MCC3859733.1 aminopeptidase P family protein [Pseudemcibacter aquimaris]WDU60127.1 aminopeptidase P family protein [Pseudemcibacter aquimaris]